MLSTWITWLFLTGVVVNGRFLESHWFVWVTQMNHLPMDIDHDKHRDWLSMQVPAGF